MKIVFAAACALAVQASPVTKVVELIKELQSKIQADGEQGQKVYDKFACWCEKTTDRKAKAIEQAKLDIARLGNEVLSLKGRVATLASEIAQLTKEIKQNEEDQAKSTSIRQKENTDFQQEKAEMEQTLNALERAVKVLSGAGTAGQSGNTDLMQLHTSERDLINAALSVADVPHKNVALIRQALKSGYAPQSASIQGILKDMYTTFATNLEEDSQSEMTAQMHFEDKMALLQKELANMQASVLKKQGQKADAQKSLADAGQNLEDTTNQMNDDAEFFDNTKKQCKAKADEWSERKRARTEELDGIALALKTLTSDEARALFDKAIKPGMETGGSNFLQLSAAPKAEAVRVLMRSAAASKSIRLAALATSLRKAGHFDKVIKSIDAMIADLDMEETDDKEKRDECKEKTHRKSEEKATLEHKIERNTLRINKLNAHVEHLVEQIQLTSDAIADTENDIAEMKANREEEHANFKQAKADDEGAIDLLHTAIGQLASYMDANNVDMGALQDGRAFVQEPEFEVSEDQAPEAQFKGHGSNKQESKGIVSILTMLKQDLQNEVENAVKADNAAEEAFQANLASAEQLLEQLVDKRTNLKGEKADTEDSIRQTEELRTTNEASLEAKNEELATLKPGCDWMFENFSKRREFRASEREGLRQAKSILAGMGNAHGSLISQKARVHRGFDDKAFATSIEHMGFLQRK